MGAISLGDRVVFPEDGGIFPKIWMLIFPNMEAFSPLKMELVFH
jgi:hypothetical protein